MEDLTGKELGAYQIISPLGKGGMAAVYKAYHPLVDRYVALKILPRHFAEDPTFFSRFTTEAKLIARLEHPHILPVYDFGHADDYTYLVMRFVKGGTLTDLLSSQPFLPLTQICKIITHIGSAIDYAHTHGVIHRDVKPANILLDQQGNCLLSDFGVATMIEGSSNLTQAGNILGTPSYISPEQGMGEDIDGRSDIYSLGVVLYQMVIGSLPYQAETPIAVVIKHIHDPLPLPKAKIANLPDSINRIILKSLAKDREARYSTGTELATALDSAIRNLSKQEREYWNHRDIDSGSEHTLSAATVKWLIKGDRGKKFPERLFVPAIVLFLLIFFGFLHYTSTVPDRIITNHPTDTGQDTVTTSKSSPPPSPGHDKVIPQAKPSTPLLPLQDEETVTRTHPLISFFSQQHEKTDTQNKSLNTLPLAPEEIDIGDLIPAPMDRVARPVGSLEIKLILDFEATPRRAILQLENHPPLSNDFSWLLTDQPTISFRQEDQGKIYDFQGLLYGDNEPTASTFCLFLIGTLHVEPKASSGAVPTDYKVTMLAPDYPSIVLPSGTWLGWASDDAQDFQN